MAIEMDTPIRILCVDDEKNVLSSLQRFFMDDDYDIVVTNSGEGGLKILDEDGPFQIIISDYRMPGMNGVDFLREVYSRDPDTIRIVLSGYADAGAIVAAINEGKIYKFVPKPWNEDELRFTIRESIERYQLQLSNKLLMRQLTTINEELELKVQERTADLELRNTALQFSQQLLAGLPVGVVGIDSNNMIAQCNHVAFNMLKNSCGDFIGNDIDHCNCSILSELVALIHGNGRIKVERDIEGNRVTIYGKSFDAIESEGLILVMIPEN